MANYRCEKCGIDMMDDSPDPEPCPICDQPMTSVGGVVLKNFGGGGVAMQGREVDPPPGK